MPAESHRLGGATRKEDVLSLLRMLLGDPDVDDCEGTSLAEFGVDTEGLMDLWAAVCEEFGERSLGPEIDPGDLDPAMSVGSAAATMADLLVRGDDGS